MLLGNVTRCRCPNREQTVQSENGWERMSIGVNVSKLNAKKKNCYEILPRKYVKAQTA